MPNKRKYAAPNDVLTAPQAADYLGISYQTLRRYISLGIVTGFRYSPNGYWRFYRNDLARVIRTSEHATYTRVTLGDLLAEAEAEGK